MKKMKIEGKKIVHSLIFFCEEAAMVFCKKGVFKNFKYITGKHLCWNLIFNKAPGLRSLWKKRLRLTFFSVDSAKFLRIFHLTDCCYL